MGILISILVIAVNLFFVIVYVDELPSVGYYVLAGVVAVAYLAFVSYLVSGYVHVYDHMREDCKISIIKSCILW